MIKKEDVLQLIDDQLKRIDDSYTMDDAAEVVLLMIRNKVENMPEAVVRCKDCDLLQDCKISQYLGLEGYCSNADMRGEK